MKAKSFFELFPPPAFLTMPTTGLSVESEMVRVITFEKKYGNSVVKKQSEYLLESGAIVAGEVVKPESFVSAFKKAKEEHGARFVRMALPEEKAYVYDAVIPMPETGELSDAVEFSIDQNIPLSAAEAVFDFAVIGEPFLNNEVKSVRIVVSAYPRAMIETWVELLGQAGITPIHFAVESQSVAHAVVPHGDKRPRLLVHFLKDKTIVAVVSEGLVRFSTSVAGGTTGGSLEQAHAEKILSSHEGEKISESIELLAVRDEVRKVFSYWLSKEGIHSKKDPQNIQSIVVTGHVADIVDVAEYLGTHAGVPAYRGNVWQNAFSVDEVVPTIEFEQSLALAVVVGVGLPD